LGDRRRRHRLDLCGRNVVWIIESASGRHPLFSDGLLPAPFGQCPLSPAGHGRRRYFDDRLEIPPYRIVVIGQLEPFLRITVLTPADAFGGD